MAATIDPITAIFGALGFGGICAVGGWVWQLSSRLTGLNITVTEARKMAEKADKRCDDTRAELQKFELEAHRHFASLATIAAFEERLDSKLAHIVDRLDRLVDNRTNAESSR